MNGSLPIWATPDARSLSAALAAHRDRIRRAALEELRHRTRPLNATRLAELRAVVQGVRHG